MNCSQIIQAILFFVLATAVCVGCGPATGGNEHEVQAVTTTPIYAEVYWTEIEVPLDKGNIAWLDDGRVAYASPYGIWVIKEWGEPVLVYDPPEGQKIEDDFLVSSGTQLGFTLKEPINAYRSKRIPTFFDLETGQQQATGWEGKLFDWRGDQVLLQNGDGIWLGSPSTLELTQANIKFSDAIHRSTPQIFDDSTLIVNDQGSIQLVNWRTGAIEVLTQVEKSFYRPVASHDGRIAWIARDNSNNSRVMLYENGAVHELNNSVLYDSDRWAALAWSSHSELVFSAHSEARGRTLWVIDIP